MAALQNFFWFARDVAGAEVRLEHFERCWSALCAFGTAQTIHQETEDPTSRFLEVLANALFTRRVFVEDAGQPGQWPVNPDPWGWEWNGHGGCQHPAAVRIGWRNALADEVYLDPGAAYTEARRLAGPDAPLGLGKKMLIKQMAEAGLLLRSRRGRNTNTETVAGERREVLVLQGCKLRPSGP